MIYQVLTSVAAVVFLAFAKDIAKIFRVVIHPYFSPMRILPGPAPTNWLFGNLKEVIDADPAEMHEKWAKEFGPVLKYKVMLQVRFLRDWCALGFEHGDTARSLVGHGLARGGAHTRKHGGLRKA
jgi:hypothetical protein